MTDTARQPLAGLPGLAHKDATALAALGITRLIDLLLYLPTRYDDWSRLAPIADIPFQAEEVSLRVKVERTRRRQTPRRRVQVVEVTFSDASAMIDVTFFNAAIGDFLRPGMEVILQGRPDYRGRLTLGNPEFTIISPDQPPPAFWPIYRGSDALPPRRLSRLIPKLVREHVAAWPDPAPADIAGRHRLPPLREALLTVHAPGAETTLIDLDRARQRLAWTELFLLEGGLALRRAALASHELPSAYSVSDRVHERILARLPFAPTADQLRAFDDIRRDLAQPGRMHRLVHGDVGTGKTAVALYALLATVAATRQAALLAPTAILAEQHHAAFDAILQGSKVRLALLTSALTAGQRRDLLAALAAGDIDLIVGTHALLEPDVVFARLGLVVIDEQHRFGVQQRHQLATRGRDNDPPHMLVMSATPIPRTLALAAFGDLDVTALHERPAGRPPVETRFVAEENEPRAMEFIRDRIEHGEQVYVVCPAVQDSPDRDVASVSKVASGLRDISRLGPTVRIDMLHGGMSSDTRISVMESFASGRTKVLVASTVVEVGLDVPAATVMLVMQPEQFGLVQLHQLRGRVGRGGRPGFCLLLGNPTTDDARERLRLITSTTDGFEIAEADLRMRGPGEWFSTRQSGMPRLRAADLVRDVELLASAKTDAADALSTGLITPAQLDAAAELVFGDSRPLVPAASG
ncbi:MAG: ATP-dependent DNA helicase RecG [Planctomycetota bacterium]